MEETLISLETAELANKKGFDIPCIYYYSQKGILSGDPIKGYRKLMHKETAAPTQSLLQKWLREKYNIIVWALPMAVSASDTKGFRYSWIIAKYGQSEDCIMDETPLGYLTWEEDLDEGLKAGLKLINQWNTN